MAREAEKQQCAQMEKAQREQSRAIMRNHNQLIVELQTMQPLSGRVCKHHHRWVIFMTRHAWSAQNTSNGMVEVLFAIALPMVPGQLEPGGRRLDGQLVGEQHFRDFR